MKLISKIPWSFSCTIFFIILFGTTNYTYAQQQRKFKAHEVINVGGGFKVEILSCKGEGSEEVCDCIYYTDKRQSGKRVMQLATKIRDEERLARKATADSIKAAKIKRPTKAPNKKVDVNKAKQSVPKVAEKNVVPAINNKPATTAKVSGIQEKEKGGVKAPALNKTVTNNTIAKEPLVPVGEEIINAPKAAADSTLLNASSANLPTKRKTERKLSVFVNCSNTYCDQNYIRTDITLVDFLLERQAADVNVLITEQGTGGGGKSYQLIFYGQNIFKKLKDTISYTIQPNSTPFEIREELTKYLKIGLIPFLAKTAYAKNISINLEAPKKVETGTTASTKDRWNYWVYRVGGDGSYSADQVYKSIRQSSYINANRTTDKLKLNFSAGANFNTSTYTYEDNGNTVEYKVNNSDFALQHLLIKSISKHWSTGYEAAYTNSTFSNNKSRKYFKPTIEYSIFPYKDFNNKYFTVNYGVEIRDNKYYDTTIYNKTAELLFGHKAQANLVLNQKWGTVNTSIRYSNYFHDWKLNNLSMSVNLEINITRGLSVYTYTSGGLVRDQIALLKGNATETEILTRRRQIASGYDFYTGFGLSYRFGSKLNNFVNPRMDPF